jgi:hypothetical protein
MGNLDIYWARLRLQKDLSHNLGPCSSPSPPEYKSNFLYVEKILLAMGQVANNIRILMLAVVRYFVPVFPKQHTPAGQLA